MLNNPSVETYYKTTSNVHQMHPLSKIICTLIFFILVIFAGYFKILGLISLLVMVIIIHTNIPLTIYYKIIKELRYIIVLIFLLSSLITLSPMFGLQLTITIILIIIYITTLNLTTRTQEIIYGLELLFKPLNHLKITTNKLILTVTLSLKFIPLTLNKSQEILQAQISRGYDYRYNPSNWYLSISNLRAAAILTIKTLQEQKNIMNLKLYNKQSEKTRKNNKKHTLFDTYFLIIHFMILLIIIMKGVLQ